MSSLISHSRIQILVFLVLITSILLSACTSSSGSLPTPSYTNTHLAPTTSIPQLLITSSKTTPTAPGTITLSPHLSSIASPPTLTVSPVPLATDSPSVTPLLPSNLILEQVYSPYDQLTALAWSGDGETLAAAAGNNVYIYFFDLGHPEPLAEQGREGSPVLSGQSILPIGAWTSQLLFDPFPVAGETSLRLALSARDGTIQFWDILTAEKLASWPAHRVSAYSLSLNTNGVMLASSGNDPMVRLWDLTAYRSTGVAAIPEIAEMIGGAFAVPAVRFSPAGDLVASVDTEAIRLRQPSTQRLVNTLRADTSIFAIEFSPGGHWLAAAEINNTVRLWNVETGEQSAVFAGPLPAPGRTAPFIWSIAFSPDGSLIAAGGSDGMLRLWSLESGEILEEWRAHSKAVTCVAFHPDGRVLASGGVDAVLRMWDAIYDAGGRK